MKKLANTSQKWTLKKLSKLLDLDPSEITSQVVIGESTPTKSTSTESTQTKSTSTQSTSTESTPTESTPTESTPTESTSTESTSTQSTSAESTPTESTSTESTSTESTSTQSTSAESTSTQSTSTESTSTQSTSTESTEKTNNSAELARQNRTVTPFEERGSVIAVVASVLVGSVLGAGGFFFLILSLKTNNSPTRTSITSEKTLPIEKKETDYEIGWLKTKLALVKQSDSLKAVSVSPIDDPLTTSEPTTSTPTTSTPTTSTPTTSTPTTSQEVYIEPTVPTPTATTQMEKWKTLAQIGSYHLPKNSHLLQKHPSLERSYLSDAQSLISNSRKSTFPNGNRFERSQQRDVPVSSTTSSIPKITQKYRNPNTRAITGSHNILKGKPFAAKLSVGASVEASLITPVVWINEKHNLDNFVVEISRQLLGDRGETILRSGDRLVLKINSVREVGNRGLIRSSASQLIRDGIDYQIPAGVIMVRGKGGEPFWANKKGSATSEKVIADAGLFVLGALGKFGEVLNRSDIESQTFYSGNSFSQSSTTRNRQPNYLGAVLEGGFNPLAAEYIRRNRRYIDSLLQGEKLWYVPKNTEVQIFVNSSFELEF